MKLTHYQRNFAIVAVCVVVGIVWTLVASENVWTGVLVGIVAGGAIAFVWDMLAKKAAGHLDDITPFGEEESENLEESGNPESPEGK